MPVLSKFLFPYGASMTSKRNNQRGDDVDSLEAGIGGPGYGTDEPATLQYGDGPGPDAQHIANTLQNGMIGAVAGIVVLGAIIALGRRYWKDKKYQEWEEAMGVDTSAYNPRRPNSGIMLGNLAPQIPPVVVVTSLRTATADPDAIEPVVDRHAQAAADGSVARPPSQEDSVDFIMRPNKPTSAYKLPPILRW